MQPVLHEIAAPPTPEELVGCLPSADQPVLLCSGGAPTPLSRYSLLAAYPILSFTSQGARCEWQSTSSGETIIQFGNPWQLLGARMAQYEMVDEPDLPFPTGGCFGYWGYDLKQFVEPRVGRRALNDLELPDCRVGFYPSLIVWDRLLGKAWIIATGLQLDGSRSQTIARQQIDRWLQLIDVARGVDRTRELPAHPLPANQLTSSVSRDQFVEAVRRALEIGRAHV